jgi:hypothetical protein
MFTLAQAKFLAGGCSSCVRGWLVQHVLGNFQCCSFHKPIRRISSQRTRIFYTRIHPWQATIHDLLSLLSQTITTPATSVMCHDRHGVRHGKFHTSRLCPTTHTSVYGSGMHSVHTGQIPPQACCDCEVSTGACRAVEDNCTTSTAAVWCTCIEQYRAFGWHCEGMPAALCQSW